MKQRSADRLPILLLLLAGLVSNVSATLKVQSNDQLLDLMNARDGSAYIDFNMAHFGVVPYGATILGYAHYDAANEDGCQQGKLEKYNSDDLQPIVVVKRGGCEFIDKTKNAQAAGASLLIIVDERGDDVKTLNAVAFHDGSKSKIPTVIIGANDGESLIKVLTDSNKDVRESVILQFTLEMDKSDEVNMKMVLAVDSVTAYRFLASFKDIAAELDNSNFHMNYTFYFDSCKECAAEVKKADCLDDSGEFCLFTSEKGAEQMKVLLFHKCALQNAQFHTDYMAFAEIYKDQCISSTRSPSDLYKCSVEKSKAFIRSGFSDIEKCVQDNLKVRPPPILTEDKKFLEDSKIRESPLVVINNRTIDGSFVVDNIFQSICFAYTNPPQTCSFLNGKYSYSQNLYGKIRQTKKSERNFFMFNLIIALVVLAVAAFLFYYIFKRTYKKMIGNNIDAMIQDSISRYKRVNVSGDVEV